MLLLKWFVGDVEKPKDIFFRLGTTLGCKYEEKKNKTFGIRVRAKEIRVHPTYLTNLADKLPPKFNSKHGK